ncbi:hypothetical protein WJX81_000853 [Elliptochloris bilobata]|uniref:Amino acid transporter transmembrane domain-containing protein n=1 Tax=Elliptochloris bilobata TaxID=381761 RepID=A0AAW1SH21_9CHLO
MALPPELSRLSASAEPFKPSCDVVSAESLPPVSQDTNGDFARLGYVPAVCVIVSTAAATMYSGILISRLCRAVPDAVIFGDIGDAALGRRGRWLSYAVIYATDATRCIILHLAATQALQAAVARPDIPLLVYGLVVAGAALVFAQIRSLSELGWFLSAGTLAQLVALALIAWGLLAAPAPEARTRLVVGGGAGALAPALIAVMNIIFAFGGQFAFVEIITAMRRPREFPAAVGASTPLMAALYLLLGAIGYWSRGEDSPELIIFGMGTGPAARAAAAAILLQALAQYLVNLNVWTHNILTLVARRRAGLSSAGRSLCDVRTACDHARAPWAVASAGVVAYSCAVAVALPFFSTLVGLVTSVTYLTCAYTLPAWFTLLLVPEMPRGERALCKYGLIPLSLLLSVAGFCASAADLVYNLGGRPA